MLNKMSYEKCYDCIHSYKAATGFGFESGPMKIICEITGQTLEITTCPKDEDLGVPFDEVENGMIEDNFHGYKGGDK